MNFSRFLLIIFFIFLSLDIALGIYYFRLNKPQEKQVIKTQQKLSSCVIFEEGFCAKGEKVYSNGKFYGLGFKLTDRIKIYSPFSGAFDQKARFSLNNTIYEGVDVFSQPTNKLDETTIRFSAIIFPKTVTEKIRVEKGEFVAEVGSQKIKINDNYNVIIIFQRFNPKTKYMKTDLNLFKEFFLSFSL